jgi:hypothetical protein
LAAGAKKSVKLPGPSCHLFSWYLKPTVASWSAFSSRLLVVAMPSLSESTYVAFNTRSVRLSMP